MGDLTRSIRTHRIIFKDNRDDIAITHDQYQHLVLAKEDKRSNEFVQIRDPDNGKVLYHGEIGKIAEFKEVEELSFSGIRWICDFGGRHSLYSECDCSIKSFNKFPNFYVLPAMWYLGFNNCTSASMITKDMRQKFYESTKNNTFIDKVREYYNNLFQ